MNLTFNELADCVSSQHECIQNFLKHTKHDCEEKDCPFDDCSTFWYVEFRKALLKTLQFGLAADAKLLKRNM